ncbi:MAG TPA: formylglycine-generating enzyme family protein, partial [Planctomycetaceae bacterium]|nr:formylglycine-generating enzyme family protein [Planctomycetaceae bacterium]
WDDGFPIHSPAGRFPPNPFGLHDLQGNVWEWCLDGFGDSTLPCAPFTGLRSAAPPGTRCIRGGSYDAPARFSRSAFRGREAPHMAYNDLGLRPARKLSEDSP